MNKRLKKVLAGWLAAIVVCSSALPVGKVETAHADAPTRLSEKGTFANSPQPGQIRIYAGAEAGQNDTAGNRMAGSVVKELYLDQNSGSEAKMESQGNGVADFGRYGWHKKVTKRVANGDAYFSYKIPVDASTAAPLYLAMEAIGEIKLTAEGRILLDTGNAGLGVQTPWEFTLDDPSLWADGYVELLFEDADPSDGEGVNLHWLELGPSSVWRDRVKHMVWDTSDVLWQAGYYEGTASEFKGTATTIAMPASGTEITRLSPAGSLTFTWNQKAPADGKQYYLLAGIIGGVGSHTFDMGGDGSAEAIREASKERISDLNVTSYIQEGENSVTIRMAQDAKLDFVSLVEVVDGATPDESLQVVFKGNEMAENWTRLVNNTMYFHMDMMTEKSTGFIDASLPNGIFPLLYWVADSAPAMLEMARWGYVDEAKQASLFRSAQNHNGGDNGAAGLVFATIAYLVKGDNYTGEYVDKAWPIMKSGLDYYVQEINDSPYHLIKGTGLETTNLGYGIYNNSIAYYALLAGAEAAGQMGHTAERTSWLTAAERLAQGISDNLIASNDRTWLGRTIAKDTWRYSLHGDKTDGSDAAWINAGWFGVGSQEDLYYGYKPSSATGDEAVELWRDITNNTLDYHSENFWADWKLYGHNRGFGTDYGVLSERGGWPLLSMFMSDRMEMAKKNLQHIIWNSTDLNFEHDNEGVQETSPWLLVREVNRHDHGIAEPHEIGNGGDNEDMNLVEYIIALKNVRVMAGLDDALAEGDNLNIIPRIPSSWEGVQVNGWRSHYRTASGDIAQTDVSYDYSIEPRRATLHVSADHAIAGSKFRFGPFAKDAIVDGVTENGSSLHEARYYEEISGDAKWVWVTGNIGTSDSIYGVDVQIPNLSFDDSFQSNALADWTSVNGDDWTAGHGELQGQSDSGDWLLHNESQEDVIYSADVRLRQEGAAGISIRTNDEGTEGYDFVLDSAAGAEGELRLETREGDVLYSQAMNVNVNRTYTLKLIAAGPILMGYLDGTKVLHMVDSTYAEGKAGLYAQGRATFDNALAIGSASSINIPTLESVAISSYKTNTMLMTQEKEIPVIATFDNGETLNVTNVPALRQYTISDPDVLIEEKGALKAAKVGSTDVYATVTINGVSRQSNTLSMKVEELAHAEIYYKDDKTNMELLIGGEAQVWPWAKLSDGIWWFLGYMPSSTDIVYTSSNPDVAVVEYDPTNVNAEARSVLHAAQAGTATITMEATVNGVTVASPNAITVNVIDPDLFTGFADNFDDGDLSGWAKNGPGVWSVEAGQAKVTNDSDTGWDSWNIVDGMGKDFVYSGDITFVSGQAAGLSFRTNNTGTVGYDVILDKNDGLKLAGRPYRSFKSSQATFVNGQTYHVKVVASGSNIKVFLNGLLKIDHNETVYNYEYGKFGMFSFKSNALFDNLKAETVLKLEKVGASADKTELVAGDTASLQLSGVLNSEDAADLNGATIGYGSSDEAVVSIDPNGRITAVGAGSATVSATVTLQGTTVRSNDVTIVVSEDHSIPLLSAVAAAAGSTKLSLGGGTVITVSGTMTDQSAADLTTATIVYASDNTAVAAVAADGRVTARGFGNANITATVTLRGVTKSSNAVPITVSGTEEFNENFDDGDTTGWTPNGGAWSNPGDRMKVDYTAPNNNWFDAWNIFNKHGQDFVYNADVKLIGGNSAGVSFRTNATGTQGYDVIFSIFDGLKLAKRPYAELKRYSDFTKETGRVYAIQVVAQGSLIKVYLDGELAIEHTDATYSAGQFGLFAFQGTAEYDNLRVSMLPDVDAPAWAEGSALAASNISQEELRLNWSEATDDRAVAAYRIYRDGALIATVAGDTLHYEAVGLNAATAYSFEVEAGDAAGNWSMQRLSVQATTLEAPVIPTPTPTTPEETPASTPRPTPQPEATGLPKHVQAIPSDVWQASSKDELVIELPEGKTELLLPVDAASKLGARSIVVKGHTGTATIDAATLSAAAKQLQSAGAEARLLVGIQALTDKESQALAQTGGIPGVKLQLAGRVVAVTFSALNGDGDIIELDGKDIPAQLTLDYDETKVNEWLLGAYRWDEESGSWSFIAGAIDRNRNQATVSGSGLSHMALIVYDKQFEDVAAGHWAHEALKVMTAQHLINGKTATTFSPGDKTTRAQFAAMLVRLLGLEASGEAEFADVDNDAWYADSVAAAYKAGIILGRDGNRFAPEATITREEIAVLLLRAFRYMHRNDSNQPQGAAETIQFTDESEFSDWAANDVRQAVELGLMTGKGNGIFDSRSDAARAETAQSIYNLFMLLAQMK